MKKLMSVILAGLMLFALTACGETGSASTSPSAAPAASGEVQASPSGDDVVRTDQYITMATGTANGANYQALVGITNIMAQTWSNYSFSPEITNGSAENIRMLASGSAQLACAQADSFYNANIGAREFDESTKGAMNFVICGNETVIHMIVRADSGINSFADMKGKKAAVGSGTIYQAYWPMFLEAYGFEEDDITATPMNMADCAAALQDGHADMFFYNSNFPHSTIQDLALNTEIKFLDVEPEIREVMCEKNPYFQETVIPAEIYELDKDVETVGTRTAIICSPDCDEQFIYDLLTTVFDNQEELALLGSTVAAYNPENALMFSDLIPMHPGAERYYKDHGMLE